MELNCRVSPDIDKLTQYNKEYSWIPGIDNIRPSEFILENKKKYFEYIDKWYESMFDYIMINIFELKSTLNNFGKLKILDIKEGKNKAKLRFIKNEFYYNLPEQTNHYVIWYYNTDNSYISDDRIRDDINKELVKIVKNKNYKFIYYENPKKSIPNIYHLHVFWILLT